MGNKPGRVNGSHLVRGPRGNYAGGVVYLVRYRCCKVVACKWLGSGGILVDKYTG